MSLTYYSGVKDVWLRDKKYGDNYSRRDNPISRITIHCVAGYWETLSSFRGCIASKDYEASWTYGVAGNGDVGYYLSESVRPWTSSNGWNDDRAITMEVANHANSDCTVTDSSLASVIDLCTDICVRHNIRGLFFTGDIRTSNLTLHRWFEDKGCPGNYLVSKMPYIARTVNNRLVLDHGMSLMSKYTDPVNDYTAGGRKFRPSVAYGSIVDNKTTPSKLISIAAKELGYTGHASTTNLDSPTANPGGKYTKYARDLTTAGYYGHSVQNTRWDDTFVDWCFYKLCGSVASAKSHLCAGSRSEDVTASNTMTRFKQGGKFNTTPTVGSIIFIQGEKVVISGVVYKVTDSRVYAIVGDHINKVSKVNYSRSSDVIQGYGHPVYQNEEEISPIPSGTPDWSGDVDDESYNNTVYGTTNLPFEYLNADYLVQYVATLDRNSPKLEYDKFIENNIAAAIVEAGYLYTSSHIKLDSTEFKSPKFYDQIKACDDADVPIGLWMTCRARSEEEAKLEMIELRKCVQVAKVSVGVWLKLVFTKSVTINDKIVTVYKEQLHKMGLQGKIGFYVTEEQLKTVTWEDQCEDWHLWLVDHIGDVDMIDELLTPQFFKLDNGDDDDVNETEETAVVNLDSLSTNFGQALEPITDVSYEFGASLGTEPGRYVSSFTDPGSNYTLPFAVFVPKNAKENMPLHVFLHGDGEVDKINLLTDTYGPMKSTKAIYGEEYPFICIYPCRHSTRWQVDPVLTTLKGLITAVCDQYQCNTERIMLSGHSGGALGAWGAVSKYGSYFSCAVPISCPSSGLNMNNMIKVPIWAFCGNQGYVYDDVTEASYGYGMQSLVNSIVNAGGDAKFTWLNKYHYQTMVDAFTEDTFNWMLAK